jgi:hypothetical protein
MKKQRNDQEAAEERPVPSQAEGADSEEEDGSRPVPSQAEGEDETVEASLRHHERKGR